MTGPVVAMAPGRVNLIGDHTDYAGGLALPMAIDLSTVASFTPGGDVLTVSSSATAERLRLDPATSHAPGSFGALLAGLLALLGDRTGLLEVSTTLPLGAGLSSSASLLVACALALGSPLRRMDLAVQCQEAELLGGQEVGLLDQMAIIGGLDGHGVLIDFSTLRTTPVAVPDDLEVVIIHSGEDRSLADGAYATRRAEVAAAEAALGPLRSSDHEAIASLADPVIARRARHVRDECARVEQFASALGTDPEAAGRLMVESHRSLADLFEVSTPRIDALVGSVCALPGVLGARMTGGGFGGCVVALARPGAIDLTAYPAAWSVRASEGARLC